MAWSAADAARLPRGSRDHIELRPATSPGRMPRHPARSAPGLSGGLVASTARAWPGAARSAWVVRSVGWVKRFSATQHRGHEFAQLKKCAARRGCDAVRAWGVGSRFDASRCSASTLDSTYVQLEALLDKLGGMSVVSHRRRLAHTVQLEARRSNSGEPHLTPPPFPRLSPPASRLDGRCCAQHCARRRKVRAPWTNGGG